MPLPSLRCWNRQQHVGPPPIDGLTRILNDGPSHTVTTSVALSPCPRQEFVDPIDWVIVGDARKDVGEIGLWVDAVQLTCLCRPPNYAERVRYGTSLSRWHRRSRARLPHSIRHSLVVQSASRKASRRSFGWKRVRLPRSYGLSFARAASLRARWACRYVCVVSTDS